MKKKLFLTLIPAFLILSACQAGPQNKQKENIFLEDTLAHEEIFGGVDLNLGAHNRGNQGIGIRKLADDPVDHVGDDPAIGVQSASESANHISFRFVAAVAFTDENIGPTEARWTRTVSKADASAYPKDTDTFESTKAYTKLSNGGSEYTIAQFNEANNTSYTHFVVYTLRNVPVDVNDYYVSAYLTLSGEGGVPLVSKAIAINASESHKFSYVATDGEYLISGSFSDTTKYIEATAVRTASNKAEFEYLDLSAGDTFVINEFYDTKLYVHGSSECLEYDGNGKIESCFEDDGFGKIKVKASMSGSYGLYLSKTDNRLYTEEGAPYGVHNGFYIKGDFNSWTEQANYEMYSVRNNVAVLENIRIEAGQNFKVYKFWSENNESWYGWHDDKVSDNGEFSWSDGGNIHCNTTGNYTIFLNGDYKVWVNPYIAA